MQENQMSGKVRKMVREGRGPLISSNRISVSSESHQETP